MLSALTKKLIKDPLHFPEEDVQQALSQILSGNESDLHAAAFLVAARASGADHTPSFLYSAVKLLRTRATPLAPPAEPPSRVDIVGTGGDGQNTFNVSTTAAIVAAGAGAHVAKHGGPASTSASGASDLLASLGADLQKANPSTAAKLLKINDFVYLSGPVFHPALASVRKLRAALGVPTVFNLVGPLLNPAPVNARVLGVYSPKLGRTYAETAAKLFPNTRTLVVCGKEGLDEVSPAGESFVWEVANDGSIKEYTVSPASFGLPAHPLTSVASGTPQQNAETLRKLLDGQLPRGDPIRDYVALNCGALLYVAGIAKDFKQGAELANESIESGRASKALQQFIQSLN